MQATATLNFFSQAEEMITSIFRQQGGWRPMAVALTPSGLKMIAIADGPDDHNAARRLKGDLLASNALAYAAAYVSVKRSSTIVEEAEARGDRILDIVATAADPKMFESGPDEALFIFMSDTTDGKVLAYGIRNGKKLTKRIAWLEQSSSPFHRLLVSRH
ncbi:hypothetical protein O9X98_06435 [Agrobacterium salinitolerans]|nr:hypothetical protein [Agrobacterium salinitolerans]